MLDVPDGVLGTILRSRRRAMLQAMLMTVFARINELAEREENPFSFMALLAAHGAVPGGGVLPVPAERDFFEAGLRRIIDLAEELRFEDYDFMDLLEDNGYVPAAATPVVLRPAFNRTEIVRRVVTMGGLMTRHAANENARLKGAGSDMGPPRAA